jgi:peroxiredoxin Q/BCP
MKLTEGDKAPPFDLPDHTGTDRGLTDYKGKGVVIYFYPRAFTPGCTTESCDFRDNYQAFVDAGYEIIGVSPDPVDRLDEFREQHALPFPLLSDEDHAMAEAYGAWGIKENYGKKYEGLIRSTIVVDGKGKVEKAWYNVRAKGHAGRVTSELLG